MAVSRRDFLRASIPRDFVDAEDNAGAFSGRLEYGRSWLDRVAPERGFARPQGLARGIGARIEPRALRGLARWTAR